MCFAKGKADPAVKSFHLGNDRLEPVKTADYLGLTWQTNARWDAHFEKILTSARKRSGIITSVIVRNGPSPTAIRLLCDALIRSKIAYGMPVWSPSSLARSHKLDVAITDPFRRSLGLPKSACIESLLTEMRALPTRYYNKLAAITTTRRAELLTPDHPTHEIITAQRLVREPTTRRKPIAQKAEQFSRNLRLESPKPKRDSRHVKKALMREHRVEWHRSGVSRLLADLTTGLHLPLYLKHDPAQIARIRARLRFDRANLQESISRRSSESKQTSCLHCGQTDTLDHLLFECPQLATARLLMHKKAQTAGLSISPDLARRWILSDLEQIDKHLHITALQISGNFIAAINNIRRL